jgi:hypothetical protein
VHKSAALEGLLVCLMVPLQACQLTLGLGQWSAADLVSVIWDLVSVA